MPLSTIGMGPVEQVLEERRQNAAVAATNFRAGADIVQFATQARLSLRAQQLQEQSLALSNRRLNLETLDFQQRSQAFELAKEKWTLERRQIEAAIASAETVAPLEKFKAAATLQAGQRQLEGQAEFEAFGSDAIGAIQSDATRKKRAIMNGLVPEPDPGMLDLFRLYPNLMTHPEVVKAQDAATKDVSDFRERWMMTAGRAGTSEARGSTLAQDFFTLQKLKETNPALAEEFERDVINQRYKSEDPEVQAEFIRFKSIASDQFADEADKDAAQARYMTAVERSKARRGLPPAPSAGSVTSPIVDYNDFLNMRNSGLVK